MGPTQIIITSRRQLNYIGISNAECIEFSNKICCFIQELLEKCLIWKKILWISPVYKKLQSDRKVLSYMSYGLDLKL